ncbi:MAG: DUF1569 domain-containing protein [Phycisphaerales bacterium JB060]
MPQTVQPVAPAIAIDTKAARRRDLHFSSFEEVSAELDRLESSLDAGTIATTGNWTPGQVFEHLGKFLKFAYDGFPTKAPPPVRWIGRLMLKRKATQTEEPIPSGFKLPRQASALLPEEDIADRDGLAFLREQIARVQRGETMTQTSPLLGRLTHEEWITLQRKHMALHLSFLDPGDAGGR